MPSSPEAGTVGVTNASRVRRGRGVAIRDLDSPLRQLIGPVELHETHGGRDVRQVVLVAWRLDVVAPSAAGYLLHACRLRP